ncbi:MAG TPA: hypothetical protein VMW23_02640 [Sedimentisphaerales bacterium]|nr:hypothetical protein [Sedimentisphaerales bacterium]
MAVNPLKQKLISWLTQEAIKVLETADSESEFIRQLTKDRKLEDVVRPEVEKVCNAATLAQMTKIVSLAARLRSAGPEKRQALKNELGKIAEQLVAKAQAQSGPMKMPDVYRRVLENL